MAGDDYKPDEKLMLLWRDFQAREAKKNSWLNLQNTLSSGIIILMLTILAKQMGWM